MFTWLPLSAKALISHPSTTKPTRVLGPTQCAIGPSLKSEEAQHVVATCAHEASLLLSLVVVHSLSHPHALPLYLVKLRQFRVLSLWIQGKQFLLLQISDSSHRHGIPPEPIPVGLGGPLSSFMGVWRLPPLQLLGQHIKCVRTSVCLFMLREVHHGKAEGVTQVRQQAMIEPIPHQVLPLIRNLLQIRAAYHCHGLVNLQHVFLHGLTILLSDLIETLS